MWYEYKKLRCVHLDETAAIGEMSSSLFTSNQEKRVSWLSVCVCVCVWWALLAGVQSWRRLYDSLRCWVVFLAQALLLPPQRVQRSWPAPANPAPNAPNASNASNASTASAAIGLKTRRVTDSVERCWLCSNYIHWRKTEWAILRVLNCKIHSYF